MRERNLNALYYEDMALIPVLISKAERISFVKKHYYHYNRHNDSTTTDREFHTEDLFEAIISSIEGAREEHRPLLTYWHARSLIHLANGERKEYIAELSAVFKHNIQLFFDNDLIRDDPYTEKIIDGRLVQPMNCAEIPDMSLTVISDLNKKFIMDDFR